MVKLLNKSDDTTQTREDESKEQNRVSAVVQNRKDDMKLYRNNCTS